MQTSSRFAVAIHTLVYLAMRNNENDSITSDMIAASVSTNPVVIRRILGSLREAQIVVSQIGSCGGWHLHRKPENITLREVYRAMENEPLFALPKRGNTRCEIGKNMQSVLNDYFRDAERAAEERLNRVTLASVMDEVWTRISKKESVQL